MDATTQTTARQVATAWENWTPADAAEAIARHFDGEIMACAISEDMHGMWSVKARIKPRDGRRRHFEHRAIGETRAEAIGRFVAEARFTAAVNQKETK